MLDHLYTFFVFILAVAFIPGISLCYFTVRICHILWFHILSAIHPDVEFIQESTVRTLVDTRRNQGIFTILLKVEGEPRVDLVRRHIHEVVTRVNKLGEPRFPKLSMLLVSRWGSYAWKKMHGKEFSVDQVLVVGGKSTHRGRPLTELNVKEHVSDIITRYLPHRVPPWQLVILPCAGSTSHYLLLRMHHLLLTDGDVNIADLLPIGPSPEPQIHNEIIQHHYDNSPLLDILERPDHVRYLYGAITENLTNRWNEFTSNHDPLNRPELLKNPQGLCGYFTTVFVAVIAIIRKIWLGYGNVSPDFESRWRYAKTCIRHELASRKIDISSLFSAILITIHPWNYFLSIVGFIYGTIILFLWRTPRRILRELQSVAFRIAKYKPRDYVQSTTVDLICDCTPMIYRAVNQIIKWVYAIYEAPKLFLDEMLIDRGWPGGTPVPLCGRKVVAWSKPISGERLREISHKTGLSCTEILLTCLGSSLSDYYQASGTPVPSQIRVTARRISSGYLFNCGPNVRPTDAVSGLLCLRVPTIKNSSQYEQCLSTVSKNVAAARLHQACVYTLSILQTKHRIVTMAIPSVFVVMLMRYLSKKYTFAVTELMAGDDGGRLRYTTWGKKITDIIYWRPPQANISMSLCLNYYGDEITLAVMSDALLSPHHVPLAEGLPHHVEALAKSVGVSYPESSF